jgi:excisionase family DNA binding protein
MTTAPTSADAAAGAAAKRFYSVPEVAEMIGTSSVTLYRAIRDGEFPAVRIRGRLVVPAKAIDAMIDAVVAEQSVVDAAAWVVVRR